VLLTGGGSAPVSAFDQPPRLARGRLFPPEKLGELEGRDREEWQEPDRIMDALGIADGSRVADIGAGGGWFTVRLARRVGPNGRVYAEDIQHQMIESIDRRMQRENLRNVETKLGTATDPKLPGNLDAVLIVDTYPQLEDAVQVLKHVAAALAPNGRLGIVDFRKDVYGPGPPMNERLEPEVIIENAARAGLRLHEHHKFLRYQYLLVFTR
jgi:ubiquinone/menaquinone biosynthesis C-methylase UbiE